MIDVPGPVGFENHWKFSRATFKGGLKLPVSTVVLGGYSITTARQMAGRVAVVTGGNKGIGLAITKALCQEFQGDVILTARDTSLGEAACSSLKELGLAPKFHQLDITSKESVGDLASFLKSTYGGLDVLVNNAGIAFKRASTAPLPEQARATVQTNLLGTLDVCRQLFPLLRPKARVVQVASMMGHLKRLNNPAMEERLSSPSLAEEEIEKIAYSYTQEVADAEPSGGILQNWPRDAAYAVSKVFLIALTKVQARDVAKLRPDDQICINACCPGYVSTDMSSHSGPLTPEEGALTPTFLALLPDGSPSGEFYKLKAITAW